VNTISSILEHIESRIAERNLLLHPFYQAWTRGELPRPALRDYARQYYHHVAAFPTYLSALHSHTEDQYVRRRILANLMGEEAGDPTHPELWLRFAESTGLSRHEVSNAKLWDETEELIGTFRSVCREGSVAQGIAALYAYESQIPKVAESKIDGLVNFYGLDTAEALDYFRVHIEADREHSRVERELLESTVKAEDAPSVTESVDAVLNSLWKLLSGVCRRHGIEC
jgi:pyrroloquinoline-quinone synthase